MNSFEQMGSIKTEMGGQLRITTGSLKTENDPTSTNDHSSEVKKNLSFSDFEVHHNNLSPSNLNIPHLKFEENVEIETTQSPDYSLWESIFSDHQLETDFMICSPVRNPNFNYNSPPRFPSPLGPYKGKGMSPMSPIHKVFNSPNNQFMQMEQVDSLSLPALESLLDDNYNYNKDELGSMEDCFDAMNMVPELLDCLTMPNTTRFCGPVVGEQSSSQEMISGIYDQVGHVVATPLSQQLEQERQQEKVHEQMQRHRERRLHQQAPPPVLPRVQQQQIHQQNQIQNMHHTFMVPVIEPEQEPDSGLQLVHLLLACAEAVSKEDYMLARRYLHHLSRVVSPLGDSMQRVAACFTEALSARLASTLANKPSTSNSKPFNPFPPDNLEILKIYQILYQACPYIKFAHFTANQAIFEAFEAEERVHVIDLDILQGYQWPAFMQALAARQGGAPFLRITGVGPSPESVMETGRCLTELAHSLHVPFEFHPVGEELEDLKPHMFNRRVGEALAVNSVNRLQRVPGNCLGNLLTMIRDQAPNIVTIVEQEASHNGPYFLGRFLEALHYYSAIFDSLDATFPADSVQRAKVEQHIFAPEIRNIVAREGPERVMRHERLEKWRKIMEGKGFQGVRLSENAVTQSKILLGLYSCDGYRLTEDKGCLLLGWQDRAILAASAWRC
ncbi:hypothetical protein ACJIZ3_015183 [Penstemon smallii]|uniref:Uncharacterized protein n=1 Tax=Penstemon smallii TaxID=265156 RepID=A0ABD3RUM2_9LAMI